MVRRKSVTTLQLCWTILLVYSVPTVLTSEYKKAKKGDNVTLMCNAKKPLNWWNKKGDIIGRQKGRIQQNIYGNLIIKSVRLSDSGLYTCSNINGSVKHKSIELKISAAPSFFNVTSEVNVKKNEEVVLYCNAEGHPEPNVTMFMYENGRIQKIANGTTLNTRIPCKYCIVVFLCKAENSLGEDSVNITVNVVGKPEVKILESPVTGDTVYAMVKKRETYQDDKWEIN
ncbi:HMCN [Acanthosepion pharaonis]|uniref:HMCN n=1 Tax=Acanthosepion pharaonis TaxID=158019 RepID=A0A812B098_ACAPH|nr:HMCN [Sepia pharaonis]